ncbi:MAG TPA: YciI family protein [Spirochaetia bacterium]|nr:YciI family protein [Spirochaetia bacterium]
MRYLCLVYQDEAEVGALSRREYETLMDDSRARDEARRRSGRYLSWAALQPVRTATTLRMENGRVTTTDGPFAETREQLGGFVLIEARDLDQAIRLASRIPPLRAGCIEVRPVRP